MCELMITEGQMLKNQIFFASQTVLQMLGLNYKPKPRREEVSGMVRTAPNLINQQMC